jgi:hypothetical protein
MHRAPKKTINLEIPVQEANSIDLEISELLLHHNLIEMHDILPTAFLLTPSQGHHSDLTKFRKRFSEIQIGKGMSLVENVPEKHCKNNQWILKPAAMN